MVCSLPGSSVYGILQTRILGWVAMPAFRGSSWPRNQTCVSCISCSAGHFFTCWVIEEAQPSSWASCKEVKRFAQGHTASKSQRKDLHLTEYLLIMYYITLIFECIEWVKEHIKILGLEIQIFISKLKKIGFKHLLSYGILKDIFFDS